jgi:predicted RNase H-like HicB family nuclease
MKYVYPALLFNDEGKVGVEIPDLPGCFTFGENMADALLMAKDAVEMWLWDAENNNENIPIASEALTIPENMTFSLIAADTDDYRKANDTRSIKKTLSIPAWLNYRAEQRNAPFSQLLQEALKSYLGMI